MSNAAVAHELGPTQRLPPPYLAVLVAGHALSTLGDWFYFVAMTWVAVEIAGTSAGLVGAAQSGATLLFGLAGGLFADRYDRVRLMVFADLVRGLTVAVVAALLASHAAVGVPTLVVVASLIGMLTAVFTPSLQASLPALVRTERQLMSLNVLFDLTVRLARAVASILAGAIALRIGLAHFFTIDAGTFFVSAGAIALIATKLRGQATAPAMRSGRGAVPRPPRAGAMARELGAALAFARSHRTLGWSIASIGLMTVVWNACCTVGLPLFAERVLGRGVDAYGLLLAAYGIGNIASNVLVGRLHGLRHASFLFVGHAVLGAGFVVVALAPSIAVALVGVTLAGVGAPMGHLASLAMIQRETPRERLGTLLSLRMVFEHAGHVLGLLVAVPLYALLPVRLGIGLMAATMVLVGAWGALRFSRWAGVHSRGRS